MSQKDIGGGGRVDVLIALNTEIRHCVMLT